MPGSIGILNVGAGDTKLVFDNTKPADVAKAAKTVTDMIRRGFVLLIEVGKDEKGPVYRRALSFDENTAEYIIAGDPMPEDSAHDQEPPIPPRRRKQRAAQIRVAASSTDAVAVARTAGG
jgi:hypothetical protein